MQRMRQGFLPVPHAGGPQDSPHGGVAPQMPRLQPLIQPALQLENPPLDSFGATGGMHALRAIFRQLCRSEKPRAETLQGAAAAAASKRRGGGHADNVDVSGSDDDEKGGRGQEDARVFDRGHNETLKLK